MDGCPVNRATPSGSGRPMMKNELRYDRSARLQQLAEANPDYGKPVAGSKTALRGQAANARISREVYELCQIIERMGAVEPDGTTKVTFGRLFEAYTAISNKLVGVLMRARKHGLVDFEGEMLFQRRDDHVVITLLQSPSSDC